jgi:hypothetical protein
VMDRRLSPLGDSALKVVSNEMKDVGAVHVCSSLGLRRPVKRLTHHKRMKWQAKVKWIFGVILTTLTSF